MIKKFCDICKKEDNGTIKEYVIPCSVSYNGYAIARNGESSWIYASTEGVSPERRELCEDCAKKIAIFILELNNDPEIKK